MAYLFSFVSLVLLNAVTATAAAAAAIVVVIIIIVFDQNPKLGGWSSNIVCHRRQNKIGVCIFATNVQHNKFDTLSCYLYLLMYTNNTHTYIVYINKYILYIWWQIRTLSQQTMNYEVFKSAGKTYTV